MMIGHIHAYTHAHAHTPTPTHSEHLKPDGGLITHLASY